MAPPYPLLLVLLITVLLSPWVSSLASPLISLLGCRNKCGNITVPYPFGFEPGCFRADYGFGLVCNETYKPLPRLFTEGGSYEITDISPSGKMHISLIAKRACYNSNGSLISSTMASTYIAFGSASSYILSLSNRFYAVGCPNQGYFMDPLGYFVSGCLSACRPAEYPLNGTNGSCTGVGCCQSSIPSGLYYYEPYLQNFVSSQSSDLPIAYGGTTNCSYVFLADSNWFHFDNSYLSRTEDFMVQVELDWAIRNKGNCSNASSMTDFACRSANHDCYDSPNGAGYLCNCSKGYQGNPYIIEGCQGIIILLILPTNNTIRLELILPFTVKPVEYKNLLKRKFIIFALWSLKGR